MQASTLRRGSAAVAFALATGFAPAATFSQAWFFGDSLTDGGAFSGVGGLPDGSRWTTNNAPNHADVLAAALGLKVVAVNSTAPNGNNYAQGGALSYTPNTPNKGPFSVLDPRYGSNTNIANLNAQVDQYLSRSGGKADPNALYFVWTGGNDIPAAVEAGVKGGPVAAQESIGDAAKSLAKQLGALKAAGAKLIIAPNLPAFGNTPATLMSGLIGGIAAQATGFKPDMAEDSPQGIAAAKLALQLRTAVWPALSQVKTLSASEQNAAIAQALKTLSAALTKTTEGPAFEATLTNLTNTVYGTNPTTDPGLVRSLNNLTAFFNSSVDAGIAQSGANVVRPDVAGLFAAVLANPKAFGVDNVTGSQCAGSSLTCSTLTPSATTPPAAPSFLFADDRHPTPLTHQVLGDYFANVLAAPAFADALGQVPLASRQVIRDTLHAHARALDAAPRAVSSVGAIVGGGFGRDHVEAGTLKPEAIGTLGFDYQASPELALGVAFSGGKTRADIGALGSYKADSLALSAIGNWRAAPLWVDGEVFLGNTDLDTRRNINLGPTYRAVQTASTRATQFGFDVNGGYRMQWGQFSTGPQAGLRYEHVKVGALIEDTLDFSAMRFGEQKVKSLVGSLGWNVATTAGRFSPYARVGYYHEFKGDARDIEAGLLSTAGNFTVEGQALPKNWGELGVGSALNVAPGVTAFAQATGSFARDDGNFWGVNVGLNATF